MADDFEDALKGDEIAQLRVMVLTLATSLRSASLFIEPSVLSDQLRAQADSAIAYIGIVGERKH